MTLEMFKNIHKIKTFILQGKESKKPLKINVFAL